jgi:hypothetical protein
MTKLNQRLGALLNACGVPGLVRPTDYRSGRFGTHVRVICGQHFTVVSIDGKEAYFRRLTGTIDGVGFTPAAEYTPAPARESRPRDEPPADRRS